MTTDALATALARHMCELDACTDPAPCPNHQTAAGVALRFLGNAGVVLPPGITIGAVWRVVRGGDDDGYVFAHRPDAEHQARYGGQTGEPDRVEQAWRVRADGFDQRTPWVPDGQPEEVR